MAKKGINRQAARVKSQKVASRENEMYYQNGSAWKQPASPRDIIERRKVEA